jgi:exopolysaccharide production protein ExoQ
MNNRRYLIDLLILANCAFVLTGAITTLTLTPGDTALEGNAFGRLILSISYLAVAGMLVTYRRETLIVVRRNWTLAVLVLLAFASCLWAETPAFTFRRSIAVAGTTLFGVALAVKLTLEEQLRLLSWMFRIISILSLACVILLPSYGISGTEVQEWRGVFGYKNAFGSMMAVSVLIEWQLPTNTRWSKVFNGVALLLSGFLLFRSNSITALMAIVGAVVLVEIYKFATLRLRMPLYATVVATLLVVSLVFVLIAPKSDAFAALLGRSSDLTGRTEIWRWVISFIQERPILGYGYSGFWFASGASADIERATGSTFMYSHNGYLDTFLTIGALGLSLAVVFLGAGLKRAYYWSQQEESRTSLWPLALLSFFLFYNLGECTIFMQDFQWALCVAAVAGSDLALFEPDTVPEDELPLTTSEAFE